MLKKFLFVTVLIVAFAASSLMAQTSDLLKLVPAEADFLFQVNLQKACADKDVLKNINDTLAKDPKKKESFDNFVAKTGLNPVTDLKAAYVFASGKADPTAPVQVAGVLLSGKFDAAKILDAISKDASASQEVTISKLNGFDAIVPKDEKDGYGVFLDASTVVAGTKAAVEAAMNVKLGKGKDISAKADLYKVVQKADSSAFLSGAGLFPEELKAKIKTNPQAAALANLNQFYFSFDVGEIINFAFNGEVDKKENMEPVMTTLNGLLGMLKMIAAQAPEFGELLNMIKLTNAETTVTLTFSIPRAKLVEIKDKIEARAKEMNSQRQQGGANAPRQ